MTNPPDPGERDPLGWSAPGGQWGSPETGGYSPYPESAQPIPAPGPGGPGSVPPPSDHIQDQPGIIPLHPLTVGQIYDGAFKAIRANPTVMFIFAAALVTVSTVIQLVLASTFLSDYVSFLGAVESDPSTLDLMNEDEALSLLTGSLVPLLLGLVVNFIVSTILNGVLTFTVSQAVLGFKPSLGQVWNEAKGQIFPLLGLVFLIGLLTASLPAALVAITVGVGLAGSVGVTVLLGILTLFASVVWGLFIVAATALATPALMLEKAGPITGLKRGWQLAKPFFWRVLGIYILTAIIASVVTYIIQVPATIIALFLPASGLIVAQGISTIIAATLVTPFTAGVIALLYIDIRIRREGLAAELAAAAR